MVNYIPSYGNANYLWHATKTVNTCQTHKKVRLQTWNYESLIRPDCVNVAHGIYAVQIKTHKRQQSLCRNECSSGVSSSTKRLLLNVYKVSSETWNDVIEFRNFILTRVFFKIFYLHCIFSLITMVLYHQLDLFWGQKSDTYFSWWLQVQTRFVPTSRLKIWDRRGLVLNHTILGLGECCLDWFKLTFMCLFHLHSMVLR